MESAADTDTRLRQKMHRGTGEQAGRRPGAEYHHLVHSQNACMAQSGSQSEHAGMYTSSLSLNPKP